jgi:adenylate cyclase
VFADWINSYFDSNYTELLDSPVTWTSLFWSLLIYTAFMAAIISFINQMNNKFGPGILIPLMLGKYRSPKEQKRFFMFVDLKSSAKHAEDLGHLEYSSMIRDCFLDLNYVLNKNYAEIYQYVGDEAVITWPVQEGVRKQACLSLFFDFKEQLNRRQKHYLKQYGFVPEFKAGLHYGIITAVEVGQIKREIAYHGDTINTAARIQSMCNHFNRSFLISESVKSILKGSHTYYQFESLGQISLKGKEKAVDLFSVEENTA